MRLRNDTQTTVPRQGSHFLYGAIIFSALASCSTSEPALAEAPSAAKAPKNPPAKLSQLALGVRDIGIWSDLDASIALPPPVLKDRGRAILDGERQLLIVYAGDSGDEPLKVYPTTGKGSIAIDGHTIQLRSADAAELAPIAKRLRFETLKKGQAPPGGDADRDGIPNTLDILIGAKKTVANAASYGAGYIKLDYPDGDVPRDVGVCSDVVIRAVRNAGVDLQSALAKDIRRAKKFYPMVKKRNSHIDHRRVKTLLPYFKRHWRERAKSIADKDDPLLPGDVVFMDTFPNRSGPDHIGIVGTALGPSGHPLIVNNWTDGSVTAELDLLDFIPVTHRFRMKP